MMRVSILEGILLLQNPSVPKLASEILSISNYFLLPCFLIALVIEYFQGLDFGSIVKKLLIIVLFMSFFMKFHQEGVKISLDAASELLQRVSPNNIFLKKFKDLKFKSSDKKFITFDFIDQILIPDLNDIVATLFYVLGKILLWILKLIYSTVYHFAYIFSGITALLYFFTWTRSALKVTVVVSIWCMIMPFVVVAILTIVGSTFEAQMNKNELMLSNIDTIVWLFGITVLLLTSSFISFGILNGDGMAASGARVTEIMGATFSKIMPYMNQSKLLSSISKLPSGNKDKNASKDNKGALNKASENSNLGNKFIQSNKALVNNNSNQANSADYKSRENTKQNVQNGSFNEKGNGSASNNTVFNKSNIKSDSTKSKTNPTLSPQKQNSYNHNQVQGKKREVKYLENKGGAQYVSKNPNLSKEVFREKRTAEVSKGKFEKSRSSRPV